MGRFEEGIERLKREEKAIPVAAIIYWKSKSNSGTLIIAPQHEHRLALIDAAEVERIYVEKLRKERAAESFNNRDCSHPVYSGGKAIEDVGVA